MKFYKALILLTLLICVLLMGCATHTLNEQKPKHKHTQITCGGWYPLFFKNYDTKRVDNLCESINLGHCSEVSITYIDNFQLACKIKDVIKKQTEYNVLLSRVKIDKHSNIEYDKEVVVILVLQ